MDQIRRFGRLQLATNIFAVTVVLTLFTGCAAMRLSRFKPVIAPPVNSCQRSDAGLLRGEEGGRFHYLLPGATANASVRTADSFEDFYAAAQARAREKLPPTLKQHKVTSAYVDFFTSVAAEAQAAAQIAGNPGLRNTAEVQNEWEKIHKHSGPKKITHRQMKDFANKLFDELNTGAAPLINVPADEQALSPAAIERMKAHRPPDEAFLTYFKAYYHGKFVDRVGRSVSAPQISLTIPDSEIAAAETVLIELLLDAIDVMPVLGDAAIDANPTFYPGGFKQKPTALTAGLANYVKINKGPAECGITTTNAWILKVLANGAGDQAAAVGGLIANTPGGVSIGLGVVGKISIGDNQTLSVIVKTAASRLAFRAALTASYLTLRNACFDVPEPGSGRTALAITCP